MKLRTKHRDYDVILDSGYIRYPRPHVRAWIRRYDHDTRIRCKLYPKLSVEEIVDMTTDMPDCYNRVIYQIPV